MAILAHKERGGSVNYWERWIGDWKRKTAFLRLDEKGAYGELLDFQYTTQDSLPISAEECCRIAGAANDAEREAVTRVLDKFFPLVNGQRWNKRALAEIEKRRAFVETQKGLANKRWDKERAKKQHKGNGTQPVAPEIAFPEWLDVESFKSWIQIRPAKARTQSAQLAALEKLTKFHGDGHDANLIVKESLANGWQGIFAPGTSRKGRQAGVEENNRRAAEEWLKNG